MWELWRMVLYPMLSLFGAIFLTCAVMCRTVTATYTLRVQPAFAPGVRLLVLLGRILWVILLASSFAAATRTTIDGKPSIPAHRARDSFIFAFLSLLNAWLAIATSIVESIFSRYAPGDLLFGRLQSRWVFGWYYEWYEWGEPHLKPRQRRPLKQAAASSLFWLVVFIIKCARAPSRPRSSVFRHRHQHARCHPAPEFCFDPRAHARAPTGTRWSTLSSPTSCVRCTHCTSSPLRW